MIKISYKNWLSSVQKWAEIVKKVKNKKHFANSRGFKNITVLENCGYCKQFLTNCEPCFLFSKEVRNYSICNDLLCDNTHLSFFIHEMRKRKPDFRIALKECEIIFTAILEDCPDKTRAIKDGIVFE